MGFEPLNTSISATNERKDKKKVIGETFSEERLNAFLEIEEIPSLPVSKDYRILLKAYRGLPLDAFQSFVPIYKAAGFEMNPIDEFGVPIQDMMAANSRHAGYAEALAACKT